MTANMTGRTRGLVLGCELASLLALATTGACRQIVGFDKGKAPSTLSAGNSGPSLQAPDGGVARIYLGECGALPHLDDACGHCIRQNCCDAARDCANDPACLALHECLSRCRPEDVNCQGTCGTSIVPIYDHANLQFAHCSRSKCADACESGCGGGLGRRAATCFQNQPACCDAEQKLWTDADAVDWLECYLHCEVIGSSGDPCGCDAAHSSMKEVTDVFRGCFAGCFVSELGASPDWSCAGRVQWPRVNTGSDTVEFRVSFADFQGLDPLPDLMVSQCAASDTLCNAPFGHGVTDATGTVTLSLKRLMQTTNAYFGYLLLQGEKVPDTLYYFFPPPMENTFTRRTTPNRGTAMSLFGAADLKFDPSLGWVGFVLTDCAYHYASGVRITSNRPEGRVVYAAGGLQDPSAMETDSSGLVSIINLQPGPIHIKTWVGETQIGSAHLMVRANGSCSAGILPPTPLDN